MAAIFLRLSCKRRERRLTGKCIKTTNILYQNVFLRHLRLTEMLRHNSRESELIVMTLPLPKKGMSPALYTAWLDIMTKDMPPTLFIRGNQQSVLTFYS